MPDEGRSSINDRAGKELVSIIIPSFNSEKTISACIVSIAETNYASLEIIVVDDCSTDNSYSVVSDLSEKLSRSIKLIKQEINAGPASARNMGAKAANGKYLFFVDSDTMMREDTINAFLFRIKDADAVVGVYDFLPLNEGYTQQYKALLNNYFFSRKGVIEYEVFDSSRAGIRADIFSSLKGFNETLQWGSDYENEEIGYRLSSKYRMLLDPNVIVRHHFPSFLQLTRTYFLRVSLWVEIFLKRRKFESGGVTSAETGLSSASLLASMILFLLSIMLPITLWKMIAMTGSFGLFIIYLYGYLGFFYFVLKRKASMLLPVIILNLFFTTTIGLGALYGILRFLTGGSRTGDV